MGHILDNRLIKQTLRVIYDHPQEGDLLMNTQGKTWEQLIQTISTDDKKTLNQPRRTSQSTVSAHHQTYKNEISNHNNKPCAKRCPRGLFSTRVRSKRQKHSQVMSTRIRCKQRQSGKQNSRKSTTTSPTSLSHRLYQPKTQIKKKKKAMTNAKAHTDH